jgi:hypothetical protein
MNKNELFSKINLYKIDWLKLSLNINAINILEKNLDKVNWGSSSKKCKCSGMYRKKSRKNRLGKFFRKYKYI